MPLLSSEVLLKLPAYLQERPAVNSSQVGKKQIMQGSGYLPISRKAAGPHSYLFPTATALQTDPHPDFDTEHDKPCDLL